MEPLVVDVVYFYPKENAQTHNAAKFEVVNDESPTTTIVRRGQPFNGVVRFTRPYDENADIVQLVFTLGDKPQMDTQGSMFLRKDVVPDQHSWSAKLTDVQGDTLSFEVSTPVSAPVGVWALRVVTRLKNSPARQIYEFDQDLYILFNPWIPDDLTYMEDCTLLQEYVLNDVGKIWVGPIKSTKGRPWFFGQFDAAVLPACMFMLDRAEIPFHQRGDPVKVTRAISRVVNSNDEGGVLVGRWDGQYEDGTAPADWTGSVDILAQYLETQQEVPYGQCWVFAGVVTTVCRALGIPSRVVTNIVSAHDANSSLSVDKYYGENMEELDFDPSNPQGADSIWNYHVWNDVWMARPDLPPGYGGWQAIDATPQEMSSGAYQCGPAPHEAIKQGTTGVGYDVEFMLSSVNADLMRWRRDPDAETGYSMVDTNNFQLDIVIPEETSVSSGGSDIILKLPPKNITEATTEFAVNRLEESDDYQTFSIGRMILTKKPYVFDPLGDEDRQDITADYKNKEGTPSERLALMNGVRHSERAKRYYSVIGNLNSDVTFKLRELDTVPIGKEFRIAVDIQNTTSEARNIKAVLTATSVFYNGVKADVLKKVEGKIFVGPNKREQISILVKDDDYLPKLVEYCNVKLSAMAIVEETKQSWADDDDFQITKPNITIKFNEDLVLNQPATAVLSFPNPLSRALTGGEFRVSSPGVAGRTVRLAAPDAPPRGHVSAELPVQPNKLGTINFVATFKSNELRDISGAASVEVFEG